VSCRLFEIRRLVDATDRRHRRAAQSKQSAQCWRNTVGLNRAHPISSAPEDDPMTHSKAMMSRAISIVLIGGALAVVHVNFAAAAGTSTLKSVANRAAPAVSSAPNLAASAENCYIDVQAVKGVRGKAVVVRSYECD
jgi:hypothetical protein